MLVTLLVSSFLSFGCLVAPPQKPAQAEKTAMAGPFPVPKEGISIKAGTEGEMTLEDLAHEFSRVTGQNLLISRDTRAMLRATSTGLNRSVEVPPQEVYPFVENILIGNDFVLTLRSDREPRLVELSSLNTGSQRGSLRNGAVFVPAKSIAAWSQHPAFLVTTVIDLPHTDVRTLSNSMRTMFTDAQTQQIIPVGNSNSLIIVGFANSVAAMVEMLTFVDDMSRKTMEEEMKKTPPAPAPKEPAAK